MIRRQTLKILLIFCTWVQTPPLIRLNKVSRERESHQTDEEEESCGRRLCAADFGRDPFNQNSDRSDRKKRTTSKGGPVFSKLFRLDRTDPLSFGPKFPEILVEWIAPFIYFFCFTRKNPTTLLVFNLALRIFILNKFWTNKNNRLCLQRLGWMAGDNTIGSFEEHKLDIFV